MMPLQMLQDRPTVITTMILPALLSSETADRGRPLRG
jgi:hypothetical protein